MTRLLVCDACTARNDETAVVCTACGHDLAYAEVVFKEAGSQGGANVPALPSPPPPPPPPRPVTADGAYCECAQTQRVAGARKCWACGLPYLDAAAGPVHVADPALQTCRTTTVRLPGGVMMALGEGLLLGRDVASRSVEDSGALQTLPGLSRVHVWIGPDGAGQLAVIDLGSRNGTWVGATRLRPGIPFVVDNAALPTAIHLGGCCEISLHSGDSA